MYLTEATKWLSNIKIGGIRRLVPLLCSKDDNKKVLVISNYQNLEYSFKFNHTFEGVLLNNYDNLEIKNGELFLKPYQTVVLK